VRAAEARPDAMASTMFVMAVWVVAMRAPSAPVSATWALVRDAVSSTQAVMKVWVSSGVSRSDCRDERMASSNSGWAMRARFSQVPLFLLAAQP